jgi:hypothetical protein
MSRAKSRSGQKKSAKLISIATNGQNSGKISRITLSDTGLKFKRGASPNIQSR